MVSSYYPSFIGRPTIELERIDSTNDFAFELVTKSNPIEGTAVFTFEQTKGRGQIGRNWHSEPYKNLNVSIILKPGFLPVHRQFYLNIISALAIQQLLEKHIEKDFKIKWPNDIYFEKLKIAGILIQNSIVGDLIEYSVIGIGLNVNQLWFDPSLPNPVSMKLISNRNHEIMELRKELYGILEEYYLKLKNGIFNQLLSEYLSCLFLSGVNAKYELNNSVRISGIIKGLSDDGKLILEIEGDLKSFNFNELKFVL